MSTILKVEDIHVYYGSIHAIKGISFHVEEGEIVTLIGANGAGKSTTLNTIAGLLRSRTGSISFMDTAIDKIPPRSRSEIRESMDEMFERFPRLKEREKQIAGTLSGGEQQMLAMARALMARPKLLMLDEPSMGLAPILVEQIFDIIKELHKAGTTILLVEQNAQAALSVANRGYVLETGKIVAEGTGAELLASPVIKRAYLGGEREEEPEKDGAYYF